jgi:hypothetical protein
LKRLQRSLDNFCLGSTRLAKKQLYLPASEGGLGLVKLTDYITAIQCSWVKRTTQHWGDNWRYDLKLKCYGNPLIADSGTFTFRENPTLSNICSSFGKFKRDFTNKENKKALILNNPFFRRGRNDDGILCERFFGKQLQGSKENLQVLRAFGIPQRKHLYFISVSGHFRDIVTPYPQLE